MSEGRLNYPVKSPPVPLSPEGERCSAIDHRRQMPVSGGFEIPTCSGDRPVARKGNGGLCYFVILMALAVLACAQGPEDQARPLAYAAIPPQGCLVSRIGGEFVEARVLVGDGQSPHTWEPNPRQVSELARSSVYFLSGMGFEENLLKRLRSAFPDLPTVDLNRGIALLPMEEHESEEGHRHDGHDHGPGEPNPHTWLDPSLARIQARTICEALSRVKPELKERFSANLARFETELDSVDALAAGLLAPFRGRAFYVFHPSFGYFAARYGLVQRAIETGGREPSARQLARLVERLAADRARVIFIQPQFPAAAARSLGQSLGVRLEELDPLAADYIDNHVRMARAIAASFAD